MTAKGLFITGTDTGVGKTRCATGLISALCIRGFSVGAMKPVAAGAVQTSAGVRNDDALQLMAATSLTVPYELVNPYCFAEPIAPHIAAAINDDPIDIERIITAYEEITHQADYTVVEGVGGWRVPLNNRETTVELAERMALPVVLVVGIRLGCLNHSLLSVESINRASVPLAGWIANSIDPHCANREENIGYLKEHIPAPLLGVVPYLNAPMQEITVFLKAEEIQKLITQQER